MEKKEIDYILNVLRRGTVAWRGRTKCLHASRVHTKIGKYKNGRDKYRFKYLCAACKEYFNDNEVEVDHIEEVGPFKGNFDDYIKRMYCDLTNLQVLCAKCHLKKTKGFIAELRFTRKKK